MQNKKEYDYNKFLGETPKFPSVEEYIEDCGIDAEHLSLEDEEHLKSTLDHWSCHIASHELYWKYARAIAGALRENDCCCSGDIIGRAIIGITNDTGNMPERSPRHLKKTILAKGAT